MSGERHGDEPATTGHSGPEDRGEAREVADAASEAELTSPGPDKHPVTGGPAVSSSHPGAGADPDLAAPADLDGDDIPH